MELKLLTTIYQSEPPNKKFKEIHLLYIASFERKMNLNPSIYQPFLLQLYVLTESLVLTGNLNIDLLY
jgi:hypothetical protein